MCNKIDLMKDNLKNLIEEWTSIKKRVDFATRRNLKNVVLGTQTRASILEQQIYRLTKAIVDAETNPGKNVDLYHGFCPYCASDQTGNTPNEQEYKEIPPFVVRTKEFTCWFCFECFTTYDLIPDLPEKTEVESYPVNEQLEAAAV